MGNREGHVCCGVGATVCKQFYKSDLIEKREASRFMSFKYLLAHLTCTQCQRVPFFNNGASLQNV